jgi:hypothetical protein
MISEKVVFQDSLWTNLVWILSRPYEWYDMPIVIACHGFWSNKKSSTNTILSQLLNNEWIAYFCYDSYARWKSEWDDLKLTISIAIDWVSNAIKCIQKKWFNKIWLFWSSYGWTCIFNYVWKHENQVCCIVWKSLVSNYYDAKEKTMNKDELQDYKLKWYRIYSARWKKYKVSYNFHLDAKKNNIWLISNSIKIPSLIIHSKDDQLIPYNQSLKTSKLLWECNLVTFKNVWHNLKSKDWKIDKNPKANKIFVEFFTTHLLPNG